MARDDAGLGAAMGNRARGGVAANLKLAPVTPLYHRVYTSLHQKLTEGQFERDRSLPGEPQLAKMYGVGRVTIRRALQQLEAEKLVIRRPGAGTYPAGGEPPGKPDHQDLRRWLEAVIPASDGTSLRDLSFGEVRAPAAVAQALELAPGSDVLRIQRVRSDGDEPLLHTTVYIAPALNSLFAGGLDTRATATVLEEGGVRLARTDQVMSAQPSDGPVAAALGVEIGTSLILVRRLIWDETDRPVHYCETLYRPDRFEYRLRLSRMGDGAAGPRWAIVD
jgi:GntR family transcriptional regulator